MNNQKTFSAIIISGLYEGFMGSCTLADNLGNVIFYPKYGKYLRKVCLKINQVKFI